jgi:hypothetical protein
LMRVRPIVHFGKNFLFERLKSLVEKLEVFSNVSFLKICLKLTNQKLF